MRQKLLHEILADIISAMSFPVTFKTAVDNGNGTYTLGKICDLHHLTPAQDITINSKKYTVKDYQPDGDKWKIIIEKNIDQATIEPLPTAPQTFQLDGPFFCHGTPIEQNAELEKITVDEKTPMIYLMEPYDTEVDHNEESSIGHRVMATLCFLSQAQTEKWQTDDFYHNAILPMINLMNDLFDAIEASQLFYFQKQKTEPKYYTKFGINIQGLGTKKLYMSEKLSGVGTKQRFEIYRVESCEC